MVVRGAEDVAFREGFRLILCNADNDPAKELVYFRDLRMFQPAGMIVIPSLESLLEPELQDPALPVVFVDRSPAWWRRDTVVADNEAGGFAVGQHMVAKGHRRLAAIGAIGLSSVGDRIEGFRRALCAAGIELDPESVRKARFSAQAGFEETLHLLDLEPRPTGIFVVSDRLAAGALRAIRERGLRCPEDVSLVGFDDMDFAGMALPPLTTVFQPGYQMGANACTLLLSRVRGCVDPFAQVVLPTELRIRSSVRALD
jgi:DNA-binding LacI/PurR family transcriptional regulator